MRILLVSSQFPIAGEPTRGRPIYQTARELATLAEVRVVSPVAMYPSWAQPKSYLFKPADAAVTGIDTAYVTYPALPIVSRPFNGWLAARAIAPELARFNPDVVLSYWLYPDAYGAMLVARKAGVPLVAGARGSDIRVRDRISKALTRRVIRSADQLLVVSEDLGRLAVGEYGADPTRVHAIANGCDAMTFHLGDRAVARTNLAIDPSVELIVYAGRLVAEKGLRELVGSMRDLVERRPGVELAMIGTGPLHDELAAEVARQTSLRVHLPGALPPEGVAQWMTAADVFALPSYSEGYPNVLVEALACGRPIVATTVGGIPEIVDAASGILVAPRDVDALAGALAQALDRCWNEAELSTRFSCAWHSVAVDTLRVCETAISMRAKAART
ncbi:MAG: glycosyltransferase [Dokdonella sp.]|uniref:glycosyltransferase n=1 Tax=Dokdonella sp. TaxID=2291710 RepID=UPI0032647C7C